MSLVTRCPACHTVFRVVQDQLKVSSGWVRCGQCHEVFNALEELFELDLPARAGAESPAAPSAPAGPPAASPPPFRPSRLPGPRDALPPPTSEPSAPTEPQPARAPALPPYSPPKLPPSPLTQGPDGARWVDPPTAPSTSAAAVVTQRREPEISASAFVPSHFVGAPHAAPGPAPEHELPGEALSTRGPTWDLDEASPSPQPPAARPPTSAPRVRPSLPVRPTEAEEAAPAAAPSVLDAWAESPAVPTAEVTPPPRFVQQAERQARWQRPAVRWSLALLALVLAALLAAQLAVLGRHDLSRHLPASRPALQRLCALWSCAVQSPRALESVVLNTSQVRQSGEPGVLRLSADLYNRADHAVQAPAIELTLHDLGGRVLARKVLPAELLRPGNPDLQPRETWAVDARLKIGSLAVSDFAVEIFYP